MKSESWNKVNNGIRMHLLFILNASGSLETIRCNAKLMQDRKVANTSSSSPAWTLNKLLHAHFNPSAHISLGLWETTWLMLNCWCWTVNYIIGASLVTITDLKALELFVWGFWVRFVIHIAISHAAGVKVGHRHWYIFQCSYSSYFKNVNCNI